MPASLRCSLVVAADARAKRSGEPPEGDPPRCVHQADAQLNWGEPPYGPDRMGRPRSIRCGGHRSSRCRSSSRSRRRRHRAGRGCRRPRGPRGCRTRSRPGRRRGVDSRRLGVDAVIHDPVRRCLDQFAHLAQINGRYAAGTGDGALLRRQTTDGSGVAVLHCVPVVALQGHQFLVGDRGPARGHGRSRGGHGCTSSALSPASLDSRQSRAGRGRRQPLRLPRNRVATCRSL